MRPEAPVHGRAGLGHVIGYVGRSRRRSSKALTSRSYEQGMIVGKDGLERQYEGLLQGDQGVRYVEVDAVGRVVGSFEGQAAAPAVPGEELYLHLDLELMEFIHEIFPDTCGGRGRAECRGRGDPGPLLGTHLRSERLRRGDQRDPLGELNQDPSRPLFNRAVVGRYPPASTWKLASAAIGLEMGVVDPDEHADRLLRILHLRA
jgi:penicillin-binding protein 2